MGGAERNSTQTGSVLVVAVVSILTVGIVATGLNALLIKGTNTFDQTIKGMQNTTASDYVNLYNDKKSDLEVKRALYGESE